MIGYAQFIVLATLLGLSKADCRDISPPALKIEQGIPRELYFRAYHEVNNECIELNLSSYSISSASLFKSEIVEGQDAVRIEPIACLDEGSSYTVTATFTSDLECFENVSKTLRGVVTFTNDQKYPCASRNLPDGYYLAGYDKEQKLTFPKFSQNETITEYKLYNKPSWVTLSAPLDGLVVLTIDSNLKRSGVFNIDLEMVLNVTVPEFQRLSFEITVVREIDWTEDTSDNLYKLRLQGVQKIANHQFAARFAFTDIETRLQNSISSTISHVKRNWEYRIQDIGTGEYIPYTTNAIDIRDDGFSLLFTEEEVEDSGPNLQIDRAQLEQQVRDDVYNEVYPGLYRSALSDALAEKRRREEAAAAAAAEAENDGARRLDEGHSIYVDNTLNSFKDLNELRLFVVPSSSSYWKTEEGGVLMRDTYIFDFEDTSKTGEFEECKYYEHDHGKLIDLVEQGNTWTMFPASYYVFDLHQDYEKKTCSRLFSISASTTTSRASVDINHDQLKVTVNSNAVNGTWFYVDIRIRSLDDLDDRYQQIRIRVISDMEPRFIKSLPQIEVYQFQSYEGYEWPQVTQGGTFEIIYVSQGGDNLETVCEKKEEYVSLTASKKEVNLIEAQNIGDYDVFVRLYARNGVSPLLFDVLTFNVISNDIEYTNELVTETSTISWTEGGTFELTFEQPIFYPGLHAPYDDFKKYIDISTRYAAITDVTETSIRGKLYYLVKSSKSSTITVTIDQTAQALSTVDSTSRVGLKGQSFKFSAKNGVQTGWSSSDRTCIADLVSNFYSINTQENVDTFFANMAAAGIDIDQTEKCRTIRPDIHEYIESLGFNVDLEDDELWLEALWFQVPKKAKKVKSRSSSLEIDIMDTDLFDSEDLVNALPAETLMSEVNSLSRKELKSSDRLEYSRDMIEALKESSYEIEKALIDQEEEEEEKTAISSAVIGVTGSAIAGASFFGAGGLMGPAISQAQVFSSLSGADSDQEGNYVQSLSGQRATYRSEETETYEQLNLALKEKKKIDDKYGRLLQTISGSGSDDEVDVPFDFYEAIIPTFILFLIMILFFGVLGMLNKAMQVRKIQNVMEDFVANSFIRFGLIFYLPMQIACIKTFKDISFSDETEDLVQLILAIILQLVLVVLIGGVAKVVAGVAKNYTEGQDFSTRNSTLFYELKENKKNMYYNLVYLIHKAALAITISVPDDTEIRIWASLVVQLFFFLFVSITRPFKMVLQGAIVAASELLILLAIFVLYARKESDDKDGANALFLLIFLVVIVLNIGLSIYKFIKGLRNDNSQIQKVQSTSANATKVNVPNATQIDISSRTDVKKEGTIEEGPSDWNVGPAKTDNQNTAGQKATTKTPAVQKKGTKTGMF